MSDNDSKNNPAGDLNPPSSSAPSSSGATAELREDQIQNAVSFLSHPKVRSSPASSKRAFLDQKGLTAAEIDEAFRRVPDTPLPSSTPSTTGALTTTANHLAPGTYAPPHAQQQIQPQQQQGIRWSQVVLGAGFTAASVYAVKSLVWPYVSEKVTTWRESRRPLSPPRIEELPSDTAILADAIKAQTAELSNSIQQLKEMVTGLDEKRPTSPEDRVATAELKSELRAIAASLNEIAGLSSNSKLPGAAVSSPSNMEVELAQIKTMLADFLKTPRSVNEQEQSTQHTPGTYRSAMDERLDTSGHPSPLQLSKKHTVDQGNPIMTSASEHASPLPPTAGRHPASYLEVLEMLERGETPPGIRTDIDDKPPDPNQEIRPARMKPPLKPWERTAAISDVDGSDKGVDSDVAAGSISLTPVIEPLPEDIPSIIRPPDTAASNNQAASPSPKQEMNGGGRRHATSIFEAATTDSADSPGVIAGRLSPPKPTRRGMASPTALFQDGDDGKDASLAAHPVSVTSALSGDAGGLGRPSSRGWKPPPIPMPSLSAASVGNGPTKGGSQASLDDEFVGAT